MSEELANNLLFGDPSIDDAGLSAPAFRVLHHLAVQADSNNETCRSITVIAKTCRMARPTVIKAIRELERTGWIVTEKQGRVTTYHIFWPPKSLEVKR